MSLEIAFSCWVAFAILCAGIALLVVWRSRDG